MPRRRRRSCARVCSRRTCRRSRNSRRCSRSTRRWRWRPATASTAGPPTSPGRCGPSPASRRPSLLSPAASRLLRSASLQLPPCVFNQALRRRSMMKRFALLSLALASAVTWGCSDNARNNNTAANAPAGGSAVGTAGTTNNQVSSGDKDFVHDVAIANMAEVDLARLASEKAATPEVKKFAQMMIDDHTTAGEKLKALASQYTIEVPAQVDDKHQDARRNLEKNQAPDFDREYADKMVDGHQDFVDKLESRVDKSKLSEWKSSHTDRANGT